MTPRTRRPSVYAAVVALPMHPHTLYEGLRVCREQVLPTLQQSLGFCGIHIVGDRTTGQTIGTVFYETEADARSEELRDRMQQVARVMELYFSGAALRREVYAVRGSRDRERCSRV